MDFKPMQRHRHYSALLNAVIAMLSLAVLPGMARAQATRIVDMPLAGGGHQRALFAAPAHPRATIVMLPGGAGDIGIAADGALRRGHNFVVRTRGLWNRRGYAVLIPDTIDRQNLRGLRSSAAYGEVVADLAAFARMQQPGPVFLLGTSQGSIAAVNGAAHASPGSVAGVVLTESVSVPGGSGETVFDAGPAQLRVPALVVANRDDRCSVAPPQDARRIAAALSASPDVRVMMVAGGLDGDHKDCGSLSPHGYDGIEPQVVGQIADWMDAHLAGR
ncbi:alpha/beta hydrolase [Labrys monachus]|uniref:Pimeloyl-ACP methyl ester carboxylesterase n=1 Tax=Labrys monachus TaxID=217067 RepID=A0ABU0F6P9_9HYPH|nr:alpha/beta hydrolase [Labrys monachus]MDQ0390231.1 pimeloyl-ACP methyl ester carboxylesterase [Labrys monachus]